jgi:hypothetical protein
VNEVEQEADRVSAAGFDIDAVTDTDLVERALPPSPVTMDDLERVIGNPALVPSGIEVSGLGPREYAFQQPNLLRKVRISGLLRAERRHCGVLVSWQSNFPSVHDWA